MFEMEIDSELFMHHFRCSDSYTSETLSNFCIQVLSEILRYGYIYQSMIQETFTPKITFSEAAY